jgi:hypothetical protein
MHDATDASSSFQITIDCSDPGLLTRFWAYALGYVLEPPPSGFDSWIDYWRSVGVAESELEDGDGCDSLVDPRGTGPRIWFQVVPEPKGVKNRVHFDLEAGGGRSVPLAERRRRVDARVDDLVHRGATVLRALGSQGDHYAVGMADPEGNEFCVH